MARGTFFQASAHIGWVAALLIAVAAQLISMYSRLGVIESTDKAQSTDIAHIQDKLDHMGALPCPKS